MLQDDTENGLPTPEELVGDLLADDMEDWPEYDTPGRKPLLRETEGHTDLLFHFTKVVVMGPCFRDNSTTKLLSNYMTEHLEAFVVITYINGYNSWMNEVWKKQENDGNQEVVDIRGVVGRTFAGSKRSHSDFLLTSPSSVSLTPTKLFTENARGRGKYKGWSSNGIELYNRIGRILGSQRRVEALGKTWETKLLLEFKTQRKGTVNTTEGPSGGLHADHGMAVYKEKMQSQGIWNIQQV